MFASSLANLMLADRLPTRKEGSVVWFLNNRDERGESTVFEVTGRLNGRRVRRTVTGRSTADRNAREMRRQGGRDVRVTRSGGWWVTR